MFKKLKSFFSNKNFEKSHKDQIVGNIIFSLSKDGNVITELYWPEFPENIDKTYIENLGSEYGTLLHLIGSGDYKTDIVETIVQAKKQNTSLADQQFISMVQFQMSFLNSFKKKYKENSPVIAPSSVFKK